VQRFVLERKPLAFRTQYNLACYLTAHPENDQDPLDWLRNALASAPPLEQARLAEWAWKDPTLKQLRERREEFSAATAPYRTSDAVNQWLSRTAQRGTRLPRLGRKRGPRSSP
jgi:hypothetical protein